jgi:hypothetical protein
VGFLVGTNVGGFEGCTVGFLVGTYAGDFEGCGVGFLVGTNVGGFVSGLGLLFLAPVASVAAAKVKYPKRRMTLLPAINFICQNAM